MKIIIGHYHLNAGGVSSIIQSQLNSLSAYQDVEMVVVSDGQGCENLTLPRNATAVNMDTLGYLPNWENSMTLLATVQKIIAFFKKAASKKDIIHFHNISLGKNVALTYAMYTLANQGYSIVNHAHDFAEERAKNYQYLKTGLQALGVKELNDVLYPKLSNYHYGVINYSDQKRLASAGINIENIHLWHNPVQVPNATIITKEAAREITCKHLKLDRQKTVVLYPVRVIERKNIGEYMFLSVLYRSHEFMVTLPPKNPKEIVHYKSWVAFGQKHKIPMHFDVGLKVDFKHLLRGADLCFTTSTMEGFGMTFVEPWLWDTPVAGRKIAKVMPDFENLGLEYPLIYNAFRVKWGKQILDFGTLDIQEQQAIIRAYLLGKTEIWDGLNPQIDAFFSSNKKISTANNKLIIRKQLSISEYGKELYQTYSTLS